MARIGYNARFDPDQIAAPVVGLASRMGPHDSGFHQHDKGQLLFTYAGSIRITTPTMMSLLPPIRIALIPPQMPHRAQMHSEIEYRSLYLDPALVFWESLTILTATPLMREVLERISHASFDTDWTIGAAYNLLAVCLDELRSAPREPMLLSMPRDTRLAHLDMETLPPLLEDLASSTGASARTITSIFQRETGMGYQTWRSTWRLLRSVDLLANGATLTETAFDIGFSSDSAFIAFFRKMTGHTPHRYILEITSGSEAWLQ